MYMAVSLAIEKLTASWLGDFLRKCIWDPLGMESTFLSYVDARAYAEVSSDTDVSLATPYMWIPAEKDNITPLEAGSDKDRFVEEPWRMPNAVSGAGANFTTVLDYSKYLDCMLHESEPIPKAGHAELRKPRMPVFESFLQTASDQPSPHVGPTMYTLGWTHNVHAPPGSKAVEIWNHGGGVYGVGAEMRYIPDLDLGIVTLGNSSPGANFAGNALCWEIIDDLLGVEQQNRFDWKKEMLLKEEKNAKDLRGMRATLFEGLDVEVNGPSPVNLEEYQGVYENIGYQSISVRVVQRPRKDEAEPEKCLQVTPSARTFIDMVYLYHVHEGWFMADRYLPYPDVDRHIQAGAGPGQLFARVRALFKRDHAGEVRSLGIEWESAMVAKAAKDSKLSGATQSGRTGDGEKTAVDWKSVETGMIWFDKVAKDLFTVDR